MMTTYIDCWGREFDSVELATEARPARTGERPIYAGHDYKGLLTHYRGLGWTHSLQAHGTECFASPDLAEADFWTTKERLPQVTHRAIFGYERR
jgi:hypothetical protein